MSAHIHTYLSAAYDINWRLSVVKLLLAELIIIYLML